METVKTICILILLIEAVFMGWVLIGYIYTLARKNIAKIELDIATKKSLEATQELNNRLLADIEKTKKEYDKTIEAIKKTTASNVTKGYSC